MGKHTNPFGALVLDGMQKFLGVVGVVARKNSGGSDTGERRRLNFIEGTNVTLTVSDDSANDEIDVTVAASSGSGGNPPTSPQGSPDVWFYADDPNITVDGSNFPTLIPNNGSVGGNWTLDGTAANRGTIVASTRNGLAVLRLDGTNDYMRYDFGAAITPSSWQVIVVGKRQAGTAGSPRVWALTTASGANTDFNDINHVVLFVQNGNNITSAWNLYRNGAYRVGDAGQPNDMQFSPRILESQSNGVHYRLTINGLEHESLVTDATPATALSAPSLLVGVGWHTTSALNGYNRMDVYEVLLYTGANVLGEDDLDLTRRYLAAKWAIPCLNLT